MCRDIFVCLKLCLLLVICTANKWELSDYRSSDELAAKDIQNKIKLSMTKHNIGVKYGPQKLQRENGVNDKSLWLDGRIPFYIDEFSYDKVLRDQIRDHLDHATTSTSLTFEEMINPPKDENERWVLFINRRGQLDCKDYSTESFTNSGVQKVIIGYDCLQTRGPMAAIVLALAGVPPQHNAPERDKFIKVDMEAILPEKRALFKKLSPDGSRGFNFNSFPYDYASVGHYHSYKYTVNGSATIKGNNAVVVNIAKCAYWTDIITEKDDYSSVDLKKIESMYKDVTVNQPQGVQLEECKSLYRPGSSNEKTKLLYVKAKSNKELLARLSSLEDSESKRRKQ